MEQDNSISQLTDNLKVNTILNRNSIWDVTDDRLQSKERESKDRQSLGSKMSRNSDDKSMQKVAEVE